MIRSRFRTMIPTLLHWRSIERYTYKYWPLACMASMSWRPAASFFRKHYPWTDRSLLSTTKMETRSKCVSKTQRSKCLACATCVYVPLHGGSPSPEGIQLVSGIPSSSHGTKTMQPGALPNDITTLPTFGFCQNFLFCFSTLSSLQIPWASCWLLN
jgi:hypothetical protein